MTGGRATLGSQDGVVGPGAAPHLAASSPFPLSLPGLVICSEKEMGGAGTVRSGMGELVASLVFLCLLCSYLLPAPVSSTFRVEPGDKAGATYSGP